MRARRRLQRLVRKQIFQFVLADILSKPPLTGALVPPRVIKQLSHCRRRPGPSLPPDLFSEPVGACGLPTEDDAEPQVRRSLHRIFEDKPYLNT